MRTDPTYLRALEGGTLLGPFALADVDEFRVALEHRDHLWTAAGFNELVLWSAEVNAVNKALNQGDDVRGATLDPVVVHWDGDQ